MWRALVMVCLAHAVGGQAGGADCAVYAFDPAPSRDECLGQIDTLRQRLPAGAAVPLADCEPAVRVPAATRQTGKATP